MALHRDINREWTLYSEHKQNVSIYILRQRRVTATVIVKCNKAMGCRVTATPSYSMRAAVKNSKPYTI